MSKKKSQEAASNVAPKIVWVDAISVHKMSYAVRVPQNATVEEIECIAKMGVEEGSIAEIAQEHLGESVVSTCVLTEEAYVERFDRCNDYLKSWTREQKLGQIDRREVGGDEMQRLLDDLAMNGTSEPKASKKKKKKSK